MLCRRKDRAYEAQEWRTFDCQALAGIDKDKLQHLRVPVPSPADCDALRMFMSSVPNLKSVCVTDLPDHKGFFKAFSALGLGLLYLSQTLRHLEMRMTNFNRPASWDPSEAFEFQEDPPFHFNLMFQRARSLVPNQILKNLLEYEHLDAKDADALLRLESLKLEKLVLPKGAFGMLFARPPLLNLSLPGCTIMPSMWDELAGRSQLKRIQNIEYGSLGSPFIRFLNTQSHVEIVEFDRPKDTYQAAGLSLEYGKSSLHIDYEKIQTAAELGPWTKWYQQNVGKEKDTYSTTKELLSQLQESGPIKSLRLPACMMDIDRENMRQLSAFSQLDALEFAFDYTNEVPSVGLVARNGVGSKKKKIQTRLVTVPSEAPRSKVIDWYHGSFSLNSLISRNLVK